MTRQRTVERFSLCHAGIHVLTSIAPSSLWRRVSCGPCGAATADPMVLEPTTVTDRAIIPLLILLAAATNQTSNSCCHSRNTFSKPRRGKQRCPRFSVSPTAGGRSSRTARNNAPGRGQVCRPRAARMCARESTGDTVRELARPQSGEAAARR